MEKILSELRAGRPIILVDDENRENEGDLILAAEKVTHEWMNFMIRHGSGIVCLTLTEQQADLLDLPLMIPDKKLHSRFAPAFTISIEARDGVTTGVSAADRTKTIQVAIREDAKPHDLCRPGHMFPIRARDGGVLTRAGHTEGSVDLARLAGLKPAAVLCELMNPDGSMARLPDIQKFATRHQLLVASIADIVKFRKSL